MSHIELSWTAKNIGIVNQPVDYDDGWHHRLKNGQSEQCWDPVEDMSRRSNNTGGQSGEESEQERSKNLVNGLNRTYLGDVTWGGFFWLI